MRYITIIVQTIVKVATEELIVIVCYDIPIEYFAMIPGGIPNGSSLGFQQDSSKDVKLHFLALKDFLYLQKSCVPSIM